MRKRKAMPDIIKALFSEGKLPKHPSKDFAMKAALTLSTKFNDKAAVLEVEPGVYTVLPYEVALAADLEELITDVVDGTEITEKDELNNFVEGLQKAALFLLVGKVGGTFSFTKEEIVSFPDANLFLILDQENETFTLTSRTPTEPKTTSIKLH